MIACEVWLRRDYLLRKNITPAEPPCTCDGCPRHILPPTPDAARNRDNAVLGEGSQP